MVNSVRFLFPGPNPVGHPMPPRWTPDGIPPNGSVVLFPMPMTGFITFPSVGFTLRKFPPQVPGYGPRPMVGSGPVPKLFPIFTGIRTAIGFISSPQDTENPTTTIPPNHSSKSPPTPAVSGGNIRFNYQWSKLRCFSHTVQMHPFHHAISTGPSPLDSKVWGNEFPHSSTPWGTNRCANLKRTHPLPIL